MEGDFDVFSLSQGSRNFYPRPHMEGDRMRMCNYYSRCFISTHALTWRATIGNTYTRYSRGISTHALTWRATGGKLND